MGKVEISANLGENFYNPNQFVDATVYAEKLGFRIAWFGDHIFPWFHSGKRSAFVWSVVPVALAKTSTIKVGPWVTVPIGARYHPAIVAQAAATIDNMYPGRLMLGVGTGEALNERPFWNGNWPKWPERMERLSEGIRLMRQLWESKKPFEFKGRFFSSDFYYLYTKPRSRIPIYSSAIGKKAAYWAGVNADGVITITPRNSLGKINEVILPSYKKGRGESRKRGLGRVAVELVFSFEKPSQLLKKSWRTLGICHKDSWSIPDPVAVEEAGRQVTVSELRKNTYFCKDWNQVVGLIEEYRRLGVSEVSIYTSCVKKQIRAIADHVVSAF